MVKKTRVLSIIVWIVCLIFIGSGRIWAEPEDDTSLDSQVILEEKLNNLPLDDIEKVLESIRGEFTELIPDFSFSKIVKDYVTGGFKLDFKTMTSGIGRFFFRETMANIKLMGQLLILVVIAAVLKIFQDTFSSQGIANLSNAIIYLLLIIIAVESYTMVAQIGYKTITTMVDFMHAILPTLFVLLISIGAIGSATIFQPLIFLLVSGISTVIKVIVFPMISFAVALSVVSSFTKEFKLSRLGGFIKEMGITILGLSFVIFFGVMLIQGVGVSVADGLSLRTAKFLTGAFVPIVGRMFADALELVVGCSLLIQNGIGLIGMLVIFIIVTLPLIKILIMVWIYKFVSAIIQPIGEQVLVDCLNNLGNTLMLVFISVTTVAIMFFIVLTMIVGIGNISVMLR